MEFEPAYYEYHVKNPHQRVVDENERAKRLSDAGLDGKKDEQEPDADLLDQFDNFYQTTKSLLVLFQIMGVMPIERSGKGKTTFRWLSGTAIYAYFLFAVETIFVTIVFRERLLLILQKGKRFDEYIYSIIFLSILIPHFLLPVAAWTNGTEVAKFKNMWTKFQLKYYEVTGTAIIFHNLSLITWSLCISSWVLGIAIMVAQYYLQPDMQLWHTFGYYHILAMLNCLCSLWFVNCTAKGRVAKDLAQNLHNALESNDPASRLAEYRDLWVDLSHMMQQLGKAYSGMYGMYCILILMTTIVASYGCLTEILDHGLSFKEAGLFLIAGYCITLLYIICNEAHHASSKMGPEFRERLLNVNLAAVDSRTRQEVHMFLTAIHKNPPIMNLNQYADINRKLISSISSVRLGAISNRAKKNCLKSTALSELLLGNDREDFACEMVALAFLLLNICLSEEVHRKKVMKRKYPSKVYEMYKERLLDTKVPKVAGVWSPWGEWSQCSRSCGGGVMHQTRHCVSKPQPSSISNNTTIETNEKDRIAHKHRRRRQDKIKKVNHCVGLYKRIHLCNTQECPIPRDFRAEQCASFNHRPFKGVVYFWEPYIKANDECALNCLAIGGGFYATLNQTVIDGTPCHHPTTITGKSAPSEIQGVCVEGSCKSISSNGIIGAVNESEEECPACLRGNCKNVSGLYTRSDLADGYNFVAQIPQGACRILVQQLKPTRNTIALRYTNGSFILNGEWKLSNSRSVEGAGTRFNYRKQERASLETVTSSGPLATPVEIMIFSFQLNTGIKYGYSVPVDSSLEQIAPPLIKPMSNDIGVEPRRLEVSSSNHQRDEAKSINPHRRIRTRRRFAWKVTGLSSCSKTCGGGIQTQIVACVRELAHTPVAERRCMHLEKPAARTASCNTEKCPEINWGGHWGPCTGSCGEGVQNYLLKCMKEDMETGRIFTVDDNHCSQPKPTASSRTCSLAPCDNSIINALPQVYEVENKKAYHKWQLGSWSPCSVTCGKGHRTRDVSCPTDQCRQDLRPMHAEHCDEGPCPNPNKPSNWLITEWSQCSEGCGTGNQSRRTHCYKDKCDDDVKPETIRACSSDKDCAGRWYTGPWGPCSNSCDGQAKETREVLCIIKVKGQTRVGMEMMCPTGNKPESERPCRGSCRSEWYMGEWTICEGNCPAGSQSRDVRCFEVNGQYSSSCNIEDMPTPRRECTCLQPEENRERYKPIQDEPPVDRNCVDKVRNCHLAVQARLCMYKYYTTHCCISCSRAPQDVHE